MIKSHRYSELVEITLSLDTGDLLKMIRNSGEVPADFEFDHDTADISMPLILTFKRKTTVEPTPKGEGT